MEGDFYSSFYTPTITTPERSLEPPDNLRDETVIEEDPDFDMDWDKTQEEL